MVDVRSAGQGPCVKKVIIYQLTKHVERIENFIHRYKDYSLNHTFMENKQYAWQILPIALFMSALLYTCL